MRRALASVLVLTLALSACGHSEGASVENVRLGMTPRDVRQRFEAGNPKGSWASSMGTAGDQIVDWRSDDPAGALATARFEFHGGMLVAVRAHYRGPANGPDRVVTPKTVLQRGGSDVTLLARDCPTHHDEAEALASGSR